MATTPFWQIRNRSFLTTKPQKKGNIDKTLMDFNRDLTGISFNGKTLLSILIDKFNLEANLDIKTQMDIVKERTTSEDISEIIKDELLSEFGESEEQREKYKNDLSKVFYQWGIIYACSQSLTNNSDVGDKGYLIQGSGLSTKVNIYTKDRKIYVEEKTELMSLAKISDISNPLKSPDGRPLATFKNKFHIKALENGSLAYKHSDLTITYNNYEVRSLYDNRNFITKVKDILKSIFKMNGIKEFTLDEESPRLSP